MTTEALKATSGATSRWDTVVRLADRAAHAWAERRRRRATVDTLMALDDHTLRDIGLDRSEIYSAVYRPLGLRRPHGRP
jgi:uncharacterized protein YjiS (DUF1127 family)